MSSNKSRQNAITAVTNYTPPSTTLNFADIKPTDLFGCNVFNDKVMKERLPKGIYKSLKKTIEHGEAIDPSIADTVAYAMKEWAMSKGATHYTHVFYPLTGSTAEKHDGFLSPDGKGSAIAEFEGKLLIQGEPDASSFPNGGLRTTFEARGYTAWDVTSPAYILENPNGTFLCIPTAFVSWKGEALDKKTPLLRANQVINTQAQRILKIFGDKSGNRVTSNAGAEQEYFLIDRNFYFARPDLQLAGRTLFGAKPAKGQELDDHYFGAIPRRVLSFMMDAEHELYKLGVPVKTRHNEVAPGQFEIAPVYEHANLATDHNQMLMTILKSIAKKHGMVCLLHEKPFAGINGSGKHLNYSLSCEGHGSLFDPGENPHKNAQFLIFCAAAIRAVHRHSKLLRAVVASASNDHRLGANEAPPAIMSIFLGKHLTEIFQKIQEGNSPTPTSSGFLKVGVDTLPTLPRDAGDRNRTSPFAFTGNRFEFRAVGSNASIAGPQVALNSMFAESLDFIATELENATKGDQSKLNAAVQKVIKDIMDNHSSIIFDGDGYSAEWHKEATEVRGLPNLPTSAEAIPAITAPEVIEMFTKYNVFTKEELESREEIYLDQYNQAIMTEAALVVKIAKTQIFPGAVRYQNELASTCANMKTIGVPFTTDVLEDVTENLRKMQAAVVNLQKIMENNTESEVGKQAHYLCYKALPAMLEVRQYADYLEDVVADDLWSLPSYSEMLFIK
ncbi:glutamine synthetase [Maridesulfovibrio ferrireducens]|uniref:Glutamine synthetase n=1 Tax=Maridesulfovibrio ferrireducens TaxID=246191 RepID=A0A1G9E9P2_9BACT|nr:glutamine synthetase III [Maridesulfovibrio ferrireducens]SDK72766.1 glutamine synthetase [Maridesulfovibrio ferrireducens]